MEFLGIQRIELDQLGLSQIYLNERKIEAVTQWFNPKHIDNFRRLPVMYDHDDIVTNQVG